MLRTNLYLLALAGVPALRLVSAEEYLGYCASDYATDCVKLTYEAKKCFPLKNPEKYGDKGSIFINLLENVRCHMYVDVDCNANVNAPVSDHIDNTGKMWEWTRDDVAHAYRCGPWPV
ncbi:hypothetical protein PMZ80_002485 [Knufia obscura]|uniref:Uncharacterized protein n=2 Tax=Knufia TaxID=430999 RepID=A0AAN8I286_9EURO|nr:hypothetical protein PMZ80_002485 [Knufia obscura]KAK5950807.1 hypothetical protein OHC33_008190 [Knufia fluminis]